MSMSAIQIHVDFINIEQTLLFLHAASKKRQIQQCFKDSVTTSQWNIKHGMSETFSYLKIFSYSLNKSLHRVMQL